MVGAQALDINLGVDDADPVLVDELTRALKAELLQLNVESVDLVDDGAAPEGAKGLPFLAIGTLVVKIASSKMLQGVFDTLRTWIMRSEGRTVKIVLDSESIELGRVTSEQQEQLIDAFISRMGPKIDAPR